MDYLQLKALDYCQIDGYCIDKVSYDERLRLSHANLMAISYAGFTSRSNQLNSQAVDALGRARLTRKIGFIRGASYAQQGEIIQVSRLTKGTLIAIIGITFWSTTGVFIAYLVTNYKMPPLLLAFWRNVLVCVALAPALFLIRRSLLTIPKSQIGFYIFYGLLLAVFNSIWALS